MLGFLYQRYMKVMKFPGGNEQHIPELEEIVVQNKPKKITTPKQSGSINHDQSATQLGNDYRGAGVFAGLLGIAIVFVAIAPSGFEITDVGVLQILGILKVTMMVGVLFLVYRVQQSNLKNVWIEARLYSESQRYSDLKIKIEALRPETSKELKDELVRILDGKDGQIQYNQTKGVQYEAVEMTAGNISWLGFITALLCAVWLLMSEFHLVHHQSWLIFGTAFLPALVGGIHGINGFLSVASLAGDHKKMAKELQVYRNDLASLVADEKISDIEKFEDTAKIIFVRLNGRDVEWAEDTKGKKLPL